MASNESSSVPARLKDLKDLVKERFLGLLGIRQPKVLLEDEQEVFLQVGRTVWHAPRQLRIELWLSSLARRHSLVSEYQAYLSQDIAREASVDIEKDVQRTFPNTRRFHAEEGQTQLRNVLRAYAAYDPEVAYCQGMNFLTGLLLMYLPSEAHAFAALVVLMEDRKLRSFYHRSMALLQVQLWQLSRLISPSLNQHLEALGVVPMLYGASWLMTAFSADFPLPFSARIMDVLLADQCECALLKVAAAIMKAVEPRLREMHDLENVLGHLKIEVPAWEEEDLHDVLTAAFTKPWTSRQLAILRSTEGAETVAQAMDRVMTMNEQLNSQTCDDEDGVEDGDVADARVAVTIPRLQPPPQPSSSFTSPACGTPVNGGMYGTGSHGGANFSPPHAVAAAAAAKCSGSFTGGAGGASGVGGGHGGGGGSVGGGSVGGAAGCSSGGSGIGAGLLLQASSSAGSGSPAVWGIPCIHPNVPASPAIQAFRRAHLPCFQAAVAAGAMGRNGAYQQPHGFRRRLSNTAPGDGTSQAGLLSEHVDHAGAQELAAGDPSDPGVGGLDSAGGGPGEEWGDFNAAIVRRQWRSILRAAPGSTRHVLMHPDDEYAAAASGGGGADGRGDDAGAAVMTGTGAGAGEAPGAHGPWHGPAFASGGGAAGPSASAAWTSSSSCGGALAPMPSQESLHGFSAAPSQPIPVPGSSSGGGGGAGRGSGSAATSALSAAAAAAAAASGKPPLPPRCASLDRGPPMVGPFSRLSVVAEDPLTVQMGPVAPAPSPRGSMDLHVLGRSSSQQLDPCEQHGLLLCGGSLGAPGTHFGGGGAVGAGGPGSGAVVGSASANGDCASGTASATTGYGGLLLSPSGISGPVSPHASSPRVFVSDWRVSGGGFGSGAGVGGSDTPTGGYIPLGMERLGSASLYDTAVSGGGAAASGTVGTLLDRSLSTGLPLLVAPLVVPLGPGSLGGGGGSDGTPFQQLASPPAGPVVDGCFQQHQEQQQQSSDMATDIAGDILRMLSAVDTGNANAAYDPRAILGESMYVDSPSKEESTLVRRGSEALRHLPSSSALAEMAAQDLAKAQEEAERVRQELEAQLAHQRAAERASCAGVAPEAPEPAPAGDAGAAPAADPSASGVVSHGGVAPDAAAAASADASSSVLNSGAGGTGGILEDQLVFRRPKLYVDGIPMFDPKSLMSESSEAQVMFTPTVSPGASSYADPHLAGFTPTGGDAGTPADPDHLASATTPSGFGTVPADPRDTWREPHGPTTAAPEPSPSDGSVPAASTATTGGSAFAAAAAAAAAAAGGVVPAPAPFLPLAGERNRATQGGEADVGSCGTAADGGRTGAKEAVGSAGGVSPGAGSHDPAVTTIAVVAGTPLSGSVASLQHLPSASEWVDWSQAPPIQGAATAALVSHDSAVGDESYDNAAAAGALMALPSDSESENSDDSGYDSEVDDRGPDDDAEEDEEEGGTPGAETTADGCTTTGLSSETSQPVGSPSRTARTEAVPPERDLIDMASPARPLDVYGLPGGLASYHHLPSGHHTHGSAGTGLSLVPVAPGPSVSSTSPPGQPGQQQHHHCRHHSRHHQGSPRRQELNNADASGHPDGPDDGTEGACGADSAVSGSSARAIPYGLLPMTSDLPSGLPPPAAPCLSFASTASFASAAGSLRFVSGASSFTGPSSGHSISGAQAQSAFRSAVAAASLAAAVTPADAAPTVAAAAAAAKPSAAATPDNFAPAGPEHLPPSAAAAAAASQGRDAVAPLDVPVAKAGDTSGRADEEKTPEQRSEAAAPCAAASAAEPPSPAAVAPEASSAAGQTEAQPGHLQQRQQQQPTGPEQLPPQQEASLGEVQAEASLSQLDGPGFGLAAESSTESRGPAPAATTTITTEAVTPCQGSRPKGQPPGSRSTPRASPLEPQGSGEVGGSAEGSDEVEGSSSFRAALSPSLAHHIMSAYLRSEQHQQQQEQRELQERLMLQEQRELHPSALLLPPQGDASAVARLGGCVEPAPGSQQLMLLPDGGGSGAVVPPAGLGLAATTHAADHGTAGGACSAGGAFPHPPLPPLPPMSILPAGPTCVLYPPGGRSSAAASGLASPVLGSPSRPPAALQQLGMLTHKALTPFAVSLDDPAVCRLSAEVLQALPPQLPPSLLLPASAGGAAAPETPTGASGFAMLMGSGSGAAAAADGGRMHTVTSVTLGSLLRGPGSGEAGEAGGLGGLGDSGGLSRLSCGGGAASLHHLAHGQPGGPNAHIHQNHHLTGLHPHPHPHATHTVMTTFGSHDLPVVAGGVGTALPLSAEPGGGGGGLSSAGGAAAAAAAAGGPHGGSAHQPHLHPPIPHTCSSRVWSTGGAVLPLLPPPPPPQVPLCPTATLAAAAATATAATAAGGQRGECANSAPAGTAAAQQSTLCSSTTMVCIQLTGISACTPEGGAGGGPSIASPETVTTVAATAPGLAAAAAASACGGAAAPPSTCHPVAAAPPAWTATFDGVDDEPTVEKSSAGGDGVRDPRVCPPRTLAPAFAAEAASTAAAAAAPGTRQD